MSWQFDCSWLLGSECRGWPCRRLQRQARPGSFHGWLRLGDDRDALLAPAAVLPAARLLGCGAAFSLLFLTFVVEMSVHDADPLHELRRKFEEAAEKNEEGVQCIIEPELADSVALLTNKKDEVDESGLHEILVSKEWESKSLTWQEICELQTMLSSPALPSVESSLVPDLKSAVGTESEPALLEPNRELQQLVAANIPIPQKLMCAMNQFAVVACKTGSQTEPSNLGVGLGGH